MARMSDYPGRRSVRWAAVLGFAVVLLMAGAGVTLAGTPQSKPGTWVSAWVTAPSSKTLEVRALGQDEITHECEPPQVRLTVTETPTEVSVSAREVRFVGALPIVNGLPYFGPTGCADVGFGPTPHAVELAAPLGERRVVDDATGVARPVLDLSKASTIAGLPADLVTTDLAIDSEHGRGAPIIRRSWQGTGRGAGQFAALVTSSTSGAPSRLSGGRQQRANGISLQMSGHEGHPRDVYYLQWHIPSGRQVNVDVHLTHGVWTRQQALEITTRTTSVE